MPPDTAASAAATTVAPRGLAPFERPAGRRGMRGVLAALVALGAIPATFLSHLPRAGSGAGSGGGAGYDYSYTYGQAGTGTALALVAMALLLLGGAAVLWRAHSRRLIAGAAIAAVAAGCGSILIVRAADRAPVSPAAVNAVAIGTPRGTVLGRLGPPLTTTDAIPTGSGPLLGCLVYAVDDRGAPASGAAFDPRADPQPITNATQNAVLCFAHDRLALRLPG